MHIEIQIDVALKDYGHLHLLCAKCGESCMLTLDTQRISHLGSGETQTQRLFNVECPKCGLLPKKLSVESAG